MRFVVSSTELLKHLNAISRVISSKNTLPILDNFLLKLGGLAFARGFFEIRSADDALAAVDVAGGRRSGTQLEIRLKRVMPWDRQPGPDDLAGGRGVGFGGDDHRGAETFR